jgi:hypothetical protein
MTRPPKPANEREGQELIKRRDKISGDLTSCPVCTQVHMPVCLFVHICLHVTHTSENLDNDRVKVFLIFLLVTLDPLVILRLEQDSLRGSVFRDFLTVL